MHLVVVVIQNRLSVVHWILAQNRVAALLLSLLVVGEVAVVV